MYPQSHGTVVTRLLDAGADILGTATCENFCNSTSSFTSAQGVVHNPFQRGYSAGGSTSGGAALVGSGLVDCAIGGDQGGSIRVPAALCGCECAFIYTLALELQLTHPCLQVSASSQLTA